MNPFANILDDAALNVLMALGRTSLSGRFYLAGGTALALQIGHRRSVDLDLFQLELREKLNFANVAAGLRKAFGSKNMMVDEKQADQVTLRIDGTKVTFLAYPFRLLEPLVAGEAVDPCLRGVSLAPVREIALMKAYSLGRRTAFRDYVDLYFLLRKGLVTLDYVMTHAPGKFMMKGETLFSSRLFLEQLVFFEDVPDRKEALHMVSESLSEAELKCFLTGKARDVVAQVGERGNGR
ncbi:MAG: nucleotidyl transferase AbiEii/AbiGii toxin family protein [Peptococcaceae bacterium]|jgi:hypothetical protein|nr:nucleotidyl transferase AbiEii/AbiGii toxin family protein [Peptococcaceae bacterium]